MTEKVTKKLSKSIDLINGESVELVLAENEGISSSDMIRTDVAGAQAADTVSDLPEEPTVASSKVGNYSPAFLELAAPVLPALANENRAKLLMQSPNRLYFYWSISKNPFHTLNRAIGGQTENYSLVVKLVNLKNDSENVHEIDAVGSWWFDVDADAEYRAEIGFYAANRPYVRIMYSNSVATPRKSPSPHPSESAEWTVTADKFARVLDIAGFSRDAFDVALAGDDWNVSEVATMSAFSRLTGNQKALVSGIGAEEIRFAMLALASGMPLSELRSRISPSLFALLESSSADLKGENALAALKEQFDFEASDVEQDEESAPAVYGSSLVNFPRKLKRSRRSSELAPFSSFSIAKPK